MTPQEGRQTQSGANQGRKWWDDSGRRRDSQLPNELSVGTSERMDAGLRALCRDSLQGARVPPQSHPDCPFPVVKLAIHDFGTTE